MQAVFDQYGFYAEIYKKQRLWYDLSRGDGMGVFQFIKQSIAFRKSCKAFAAERVKQEERYLQMDAYQLSVLKDDELLDAIWTRAEHVVSSQDNPAEGFSLLNTQQKIFYAVNYLEMEVNNGGLCQFFVNSSRIVAPLISEYLGVIGASQHKKLYDTFIEKHKINLADLSSFDSVTVEAFQSQYSRYPFEEYDDAFYELESLRDHLIPFAKKHIEKF